MSSFNCTDPVHQCEYGFDNCASCDAAFKERYEGPRIVGGKPPGRLIRLATAARMLGASKLRVDQWIKADILPAERYANGWRIRQGDVAELIERLAITDTKPWAIGSRSTGLSETSVKIVLALDDRGKILDLRLQELVNCTARALRSNLNKLLELDMIELLSDGRFAIKPLGREALTRVDPTLIDLIKADLFIF